MALALNSTLGVSMANILPLMVLMDSILGRVKERRLSLIAVGDVELVAFMTALEHMIS